MKVKISTAHLGLLVLLSRFVAGIPSGRTKREALARKLIDSAIAGVPWAMKILMNRLWPEGFQADIAEPEPEKKHDLSKLTTEELRTLHELALKYEVD